MTQTRKLYRSRKERIIFGVCGGLADYFQVDPILVRLVFIILAVSGGSGILIYLILALITPLEGSDPKSHSQIRANHLKAELRDSAQKMNDRWQNSRLEMRNLFGLVIISIGVLIFVTHYLRLWINWSLFFSIVIVLIGLGLIIKSDKK